MSENTQINTGYTSLEEIISHVRKYHPTEDISVIEKAYRLAEDAHKDQKRLSGEPYFAHPTAVAIILADLMLDPATVAAGLLHDCVEDVKSITLDVVEKNFGSEIALMVDGVTKLTRMDFFTREDQQAESIRKMLIAMSKDIRVVLIKLADRLHNMRTLKTQKPARQIPIAKETLDIYAPLAHRLGVYAVKWELEDLALRYIDPDAFYQLVEKVGMKRSEREDWIREIVESLKEKLGERGIKGEIDGRPKHFYSIYRKMKTQNKTFEQITDLIAVRVIVNTQEECYSALGVIHSLWPLIPGRFKDYISVPKNNLYQSLHTTVVGKEGRPFEVQIRTMEMHRAAEYGIAAHWRYKEGKAADTLDEKLSWLRRIMEWQSETGDSREFGNLLRVDLFAEEVLVFTPKGDIISLPKGASPLDFAYRIHSAVGNRCVGAKINHRIVPLTTQLQTGDFVEIMTSANSHGPSRDWLNIVKTSEAKAKIRSFLKNESKDENIVRGRELLEKEAKRLGYTFSQLCKTEFLEVIYKRYTLSSQDDLYVTVGFGGLSAPQVINRLAEEFKKTQKAEPVKPVEVTETPAARPAAPQGSAQGIIVEGNPGMLVRFAHCCNPLPGDDIIGYVTRGRGVSVHRSDCQNMQDEGVEPERMVRVEWEASGAGSYDADIQVIGYDKAGLLADLSTIFATLEVPIVAVAARTMKNGTSQITLTLSIKNTTQLEKIIRQLRKRSDIIEVFRVSS
ncbi:MAG: bifunctional (p)ppGpp synthetase/guanosine-3',5'-bis(diphosphate) 3'-pyrophosphohydrolase [Clostridia bacterium]|nr:bifunctional (p)ppGpp synthetase/guanosine-3',5'-bis(diphosphate) 3'-pyrophosphohydrolase [Clostridia bacterium]